MSLALIGVSVVQASTRSAESLAVGSLDNSAQRSSATPLGRAAGLDVTTDFGIPTFVAVSQTRSERPRMLTGSVPIAMPKESYCVLSSR